MDKAQILTQNALMRQARLDPIPMNPVTGEPAKPIRVAIEVIPTMQIVADQLVPQGEHVIDIFETQLPSVMAMVETATEEQLGAVRLFEQNHRADIEANRENTEAFDPSFEASFQRVMRRSPKALAYARVLDVEPAEPAESTSRRKAS